MRHVVVITGVMGGIGSATATVFKRYGWSVLGMDRRENSGLALDDFRIVDLTDAEGVTSALEDFSGRGIDALVNNAAVSHRVSLRKGDPAEWEEMMSVNLRAAIFATSAIAGAMESRGGGAVVNVSSVHALATTVGSSAYATTKAGLVGFTRAAAIELAPAGIRVNAVLPGAVDTPMLHAGDKNSDRIAQIASRTPLGRIGRPTEIAEAIVFLADSDRSSFVTGQTLVVDGGAMACLSTE